MPVLNWIGKDKVINHHLDVPYRVLEKQYTYNAETNSENKIIHGDNLEALKSLLPEYEGRIKCIYIDPPYNTGNEGWVYNDNVNDPKIKKWLGEVVGKESEDLTRHDKWLCMMYPRLKLLHRLLADDGAIFISIDDNEQANLRLMCDEIFGGGNFISNLIWQKRKGGGNDSLYVATDHEYLLCYVKNEQKQNEKWRVEYTGDYLKRYKEQDEFGLFYWDTLSRAGLNNPIVYDIECPDGSVIKDGTWQISKATFEDKLKIGEVAFIKNKLGGYTVVKKVRMPDGKVFRSIINEVTNKNAADEMQDILGEKKSFSTPKPSILIQRILELSTNKDSIILDSFAGSGTTAHAVLNLNKQDGGNRKFILVEMEDYADSITAERVKRVIDGYGEGKNTVEGTGGNFSYYELGQPMFLECDYLNEELPLQEIHRYIWYTETARPFDELQKEHPHILGVNDNSSYYFFYEKDSLTTLNYDYLHTIKQKSDTYVIYADNCVLPKEFLAKNNIIFKKIPRDITRF